MKAKMGLGSGTAGSFWSTLEGTVVATCLSKCVQAHRCVQKVSKAEVVALIDSLPSMHATLQSPIKLSIVEHTCNTSTWEMEAGEFKASVGIRGLHFKKKSWKS